jgi:hypothetical protein
LDEIAGLKAQLGGRSGDQGALDVGVLNSSSEALKLVKNLDQQRTKDFEAGQQSFQKPFRPGIANASP